MVNLFLLLLDYSYVCVDCCRVKSLISFREEFLELQQCWISMTISRLGPHAATSLNLSELEMLDRDVLATSPSQITAGELWNSFQGPHRGVRLKYQDFYLVSHSTVLTSSYAYELVASAAKSSFSSHNWKLNGPLPPYPIGQFFRRKCIIFYSLTNLVKAIVLS